MADERLRIVIEALNKAEAELKSLQRDLGGIEAKAKPAGKSLDFVKTALLGAFSVAAIQRIGKTVVELGKMGAEAERTQASFENIVGGSAAAASMLDQLQQATMNTRSEMELMEGATNLMALGLGDTADDIANIMRNVEALGGRFGGTMQTFQLMMSNDSLRRIDSFGIGVEEATERIEAFKDAGMDADEAFDTAILELMNEKYEQLGGTMDDNLAAVQRQEAAWKDLKAELGVFLSDTVAVGSEAFGKLTRRLADSVGFINDLAGAIDDLPLEKLRILNLLMGGYDPALQKRLHDEAMALQEQETNYQRVAAAADGYASRLDHYKQTQDDVASATTQATDTFDDFRRQMEDTTTDKNLRWWEDWADAANAAKDAAAQMDFTSWAVDQDFGAQMGAAGEALDDLRSKAAGLESQLANADLTPEEIGALRQQLSDVRTDIDNVSASMRQMAAQFVLGLIEMQIAADGKITEIEAQMYTAYAYQMGLIDETAVNMANSITAILGDATLSAEEKMQALLDITQGAVDKYGELGDVGTGSLSDIATKADDARQAMLDLGLSAEAAQIMIDKMHGKKIDMEVHWLERGRPTLPGGAQKMEPIGPEGWNAAGGDYIVSRPTLFGAGDRGKERAIFIPQGEPGYDAPNAAMAALMYSGALIAPNSTGGGGGGDGPSGIGGINIYINGAMDPALVASEVKRQLKPYMGAVNLR